MTVVIGHAAVLVGAAVAVPTFCTLHATRYTLRERAGTVVIGHAAVLVLAAVAVVLALRAVAFVLLRSGVHTSGLRHAVLNP